MSPLKNALYLCSALSLALLIPASCGDSEDGTGTPESTSPPSQEQTPSNATPTPIHQTCNETLYNQCWDTYDLCIDPGGSCFVEGVPDQACFTACLEVYCTCFEQTNCVSPQANCDSLQGS